MIYVVLCTCVYAAQLCRPYNKPSTECGIPLRGKQTGTFALDGLGIIYTYDSNIALMLIRKRAGVREIRSKTGETEEEQRFDRSSCRVWLIYSTWQTNITNW